MEEFESRCSALADMLASLNLASRGETLPKHEKQDSC